VVSFAFFGRASAQNPTLPADLDSFLAVHPDGSVTIFTSHVDPGTGLKRGLPADRGGRSSAFR